MHTLSVRWGLALCSMAVLWFGSGEAASKFNRLDVSIEDLHLTRTRRIVDTYTVGFLGKGGVMLHSRAKREALPETPGAGEEAGQPSFGDKVGTWIGTVGDWMDKANQAFSPVQGIVKTATDIMALLRANRKAKFEQKMAELKYNLDVEKLCSEICALGWGPWTPCTQRCGGGTRNRTRDLIKPGSCTTLPNFRCPADPRQSAQCNNECANGGRPFLTGGCECRRGFEGECCDNGVICPFLGKPSNGNVEGKFPAGYGTMVSYTCKEGYSLIGQDQTYCGADGKWSSARPTCKLVTCDKPEDPDNGRILNAPENYRVGDQIDYLCDPGYNMIGPNKRHCISWEGGEGRWTGFSPFCQEVDCGDPGEPVNGWRRGDNFRLEDQVSFRCNDGFRLVGSPVRICLPNGKWSGHEATCETIMCDAPEVTKFAVLRSSATQFPFGTQVRYECEGGYRLLGSDTLRCVEDKEFGMLTSGGKWDEEAPKCVGAECPTLRDLDHGAKDGSIYNYPYNVTFSCFAGYVLQGLKTIMCQRNGQWSSSMPTCQSCPKNTYRAAGAEGGCRYCPAYSHTVTTASTNLLQCTCDQGFSGPPGGPCEEVICPVLEPPAHGKITDCGNRLDDQCDVTCNEGYVMEEGSPRRTCEKISQWSGRDPLCKACPLNTYKSDDRSCLPCPRNSHTDVTGSTEEDCVCDDGYSTTSAGTCRDINECESAANPCQDLCRNTQGGFVCECSIPGYILALDKKTCLQDETCRNLTEADAPGNGGLICHWYREENSQQCGLGCNPGFTIPSMVNNYERCGPVTEFKWSFEEREEDIPDCIAEEFANVKVNANTTYFVRACNQLTPQEQEVVKEQFAQMLTDHGVCKSKRRSAEKTICQAKNVGIICGRTVRRRKRGLFETEEDEVDFSFTLLPTIEGIDVNNVKLSDCDKICESLRIPESRCPDLCEETYRRWVLAAARFGKQSLEQAFQGQPMRFEAADRHFEPSDEALQSSDVISECPPGSRSDGEYCVPCSPGTFLHAARDICVPCRPGFYTNQLHQTECKPCPAGTFNRRPGSAKCKECPDGYYGVGCRQRTGLRCVNGQMDKATGQCVCHSGWEGTACDTDIQSCWEDSCDLGVTCHDIRAPGLGVVCGDCPQGMTEVGSQCVPMAR